MVTLLKPKGCRAGEHEYEPTPYAVDAGYQQAPDGTRVDGHWLRYRCHRCHHTAEQWQPEGAEAPSAPARLHTGEDNLAPEPPGNFWERPGVLWAVLALVLALAAYGYFWDNHVRSNAYPEGPQIIKPTTIGGGNAGQ